MQTNQNNANDTPITVKLFVKKIPRTAGKTKFVEGFAKFGQIADAYLSKPSKDGEENGGWGIVIVNHNVATVLLRETILIGEDIVQISPYVAKTRSTTPW